jgi:hypothetical protein
MWVPIPHTKPTATRKITWPKKIDYFFSNLFNICYILLLIKSFSIFLVKKIVKNVDWVDIWHPTLYNWINGLPKKAGLYW